MFRTPSKVQKGGMTSQEHETQPLYLRVARFNGERPAGRAYNQLQDAIFYSPGCDLSVFLYLLRRDWYSPRPFQMRSWPRCNDVGLRPPVLGRGSSFTTTLLPRSSCSLSFYHVSDLASVLAR